MGAPVLEARGLTKRFGEGAAQVVAVREASLAVAPREVVMIMGPSGSGKTTLLTMVGLLLRPDEGDVRIRGEAVSDLPEPRLAAVRRTSLGFVFQNFLLFPSLTAVENIELAANVAGVRGAAARGKAEALLADLGLARRMQARPAELSGGEKQRVAVARALVNDPAILLADEPTANLDSATGRKVAELIHGIAHERDCAVLIVSHDERLCRMTDTMYHMEDGRIVRTTPGGRSLDAQPLGEDVAAQGLPHGHAGTS